MGDYLDNGCSLQEQLNKHILCIYCPITANVCFSIYLKYIVSKQMIKNGFLFTFFIIPCKYSKTCVKQITRKDKTKRLLTNGSLMKVKNISKCSKGSILQYV